MAKPEPERDEDGYLPDETVFKVRPPDPVWLRMLVLVAMVGHVASFFAAAFGLVTLPVFLYFTIMPLMLLSYRQRDRHLKAMYQSPDHRPGAYERASEAALAQNRWTKPIRGTEFLDAWVFGSGWRGGVFWVGLFAATFAIVVSILLIACLFRC